MSIPYQPQRLRRTWRDDAPSSSVPSVVMQRPITLDGMKPAVDPRPVPRQMAPESCITTQETMIPTHVQLVGRDNAGRIRIIVQVERDEQGVTWIERVMRHYLAWRYGACDIRLVG